ncbi:FecCD family ABC transporter permease [Anaerovorax odorimutans]|uniref:FecCD family ABC transporter permease n=1 Tax=Anaerovorax odorimutans TaxID=109327 RepID=UPI0003F7E450|nr:iron ABC transporter permease [Anaerovorax odorimutans]
MAKQKLRILWIFLFAVILIIAMMISIVSGTLDFSVSNILKVFLKGNADHLTQHIIINVRLPRTLVGMLVGVNLGIAGALLQGLLRNNLASPNIIGVNSGAGLAAVIMMCFMPGSINMLPSATFLGALLTSLLIYSISKKKGNSSNVTIILAGVALNALLHALTSAIMILNSDELAVTYTWLIGGLNGRGWIHYESILYYSLFGIIASIFLSPRINLFLLGEDMGKNLGLSVEFSRILIIITASILAGSAVSVAGTIGFIGLCSPHIARLIIGNDYRYLVVFSGILGGLILVVSDTLARVMFQPMELPVGILTAILGTPFFLFLIYSRRRNI